MNKGFIKIFTAVFLISAFSYYIPVSADSVYDSSNIKNDSTEEITSEIWSDNASLLDEDLIDCYEDYGDAPKDEKQHSSFKTPLYGSASSESISQALQNQYRSIDQIRSFAKSHPVQDCVTGYSTHPVFSAPYIAGQIDSATSQDAINCLNQIRYIAGLYSNVALRDDYSEKAQAASLVNFVNKTLSHFPSKPNDMESDLFQLGLQGASSSNIAMGWGYNHSLAYTIYGMYLNDGNSSNIDRVGHRRWILNPSMKYTGFGYVNDDDYYYSATYAFDTQGGSSKGTISMWPAQNTPISYFGSDYPWSFSTGKTESINNVKVVLTNLRTGTKWSFNSDFSDGFFNVNNEGYGISGCIIFRPSSVTYNEGDTYHVNISGLASGEVVDYDVNFFDLFSNWTPISDGIHAGSDGNYYLYQNGIIDSGFNDLYYDSTYGWRIVFNGKVDSNYNDLFCSPTYGWWKIANGTLDYTYNDMYYSPTYGWWKIENGQINVGYNDLYCSPTIGWWKIVSGTLDYTYNDMYYSPTYGWWKIENGQINVGYNDLYYSPTIGWWKVVSGTLDYTYNDMYYSPTYGWWKIENGQINVGYNDLYNSPTIGWWKIVSGTLDYTYNEMYCSPTYGWRKIADGRIDINYNDLYYSSLCGWLKIEDGTHDMNYNDLFYSPRYGWWKVVDGTIDVNYSGTYYSPLYNVTWTISDGAVVF